MLENIRKLISGERGVGKSFYVKKMIKDNNLSCEGILTKRVANGVTLSYMRDFKILKKKYCAKIIDAKMVADISVFENFGVEILDILQNSNKLIVIDEIGFLELNAKEYCRKLVNLLTTKKNIIAVLRAQENILINKILGLKNFEYHFINKKI